MTVLGRVAILTADFYNRDPRRVARALLGKLVIRKTPHGNLAGRIVETEAYLGQDDAADLRSPLRASRDDAMLNAAIDAAIARKPKGHDFMIDRRHRMPALARHMSLTGG